MRGLLVIGQTFLPHILHTHQGQGAGEWRVGMAGEPRPRHGQAVLAATFVADGPSAEQQQHHVLWDMEALLGRDK
jgi:hypothetical protein